MTNILFIHNTLQYTLFFDTASLYPNRTFTLTACQDPAQSPLLLLLGFTFMPPQPLTSMSLLLPFLFYTSLLYSTIVKSTLSSIVKLLFQHSLTLPFLSHLKTILVSSFIFSTFSQHLFYLCYSPNLSFTFS